MDILYIKGRPSKADDLELRCSLRSIARYGRNVGRVFVCGTCPGWLSDDVVKIHCKDVYRGGKLTQAQKNCNILAKILYTVDNSDIGEEFLVSMDDHFYCRETDFNAYPVYARNRRRWGTQLPENDRRSEYLSFLSDVRKTLESRGLPTLNFTLHRSKHIFRSDINACRKFLDRAVKKALPVECFVYLLNYRYSVAPFPYTTVLDVKITSSSQWQMTTDTDIFSTGDFSKRSKLAKLLSAKYNEKCKYEL